MSAFPDGLSILTEKPLVLQMTLMASSCVVIVLYVIDLYRYEKNLWFQENTETSAEQESEKKLENDSERILWALQNIGKKEMLIPKIALGGRTAATQLTCRNTTSLLVFNTATLEGIVPGYYYWDEGQWICLTATDNFEADENNEANHMIPLSDVPEEVMDKILVFNKNSGSIVDLLENNTDVPAYNNIDPPHRLSISEP